jgi:hypothetical protein
MRDGITQAVLDALAADGITTALAARLDFKSESLFVWTGVGAIIPSGSGDSQLDGNRFEPLDNGVVLNIGDNSFSYSGSEALEITLAVPSSQTTAIAAAQVFPDEYQARPFTLWRALLKQPDDPLAQPLWFFRRLRAGAMDKVEISNDGNSHTFKLTVESHASLISAATQQTYLDQERYDPADTSQRYAASIANGSPAPTKGGMAGFGSIFNGR